MFSKLSSVLSQFSQWITSQWIQEVPNEYAACEFNCRQGQCRAGEWERCDSRLREARLGASPAE